MRCITRIHLSDCGWHEAYYPGTSVHLADPRTGEPTHTVFSLENTGGKTSFLSLVLSCFDTSERRFLKTLIRPNQKFADYFGEVPAFILVEWDLSGGQAALLEAQRLITGQDCGAAGRGPPARAGAAISSRSGARRASLSTTSPRRDSKVSRSTAGCGAIRTCSAGFTRCARATPATSRIF